MYLAHYSVLHHHSYHIGLLVFVSGFRPATLLPRYLPILKLYLCLQEIVAKPTIGSNTLNTKPYLNDVVSIFQTSVLICEERHLQIREVSVCNSLV